MRELKVFKKVWDIVKQNKTYFFLSYIILLLELALNESVKGWTC